MAVTTLSPAKPTTDDPFSGLSFCGNQARLWDSDRYLAAVFSPPNRREAIFTVLAFNAEIARVRDTVREPMLGQIRLQWWREALDEAERGHPRDHPVVQALADLFDGYSLTRQNFDRLIDARVSDLEDAPFPDIRAFVHYVHETTHPLAELLLETLMVEHPGTRKTVRDIAMAFTLTGIVRAMPYGDGRGRYNLPKVLFAGHQASYARRQAAETLSNWARNRLHRARRNGVFRADYERTRPVLFWAGVTDYYLSALRKKSYEPTLIPRKRSAFLPLLLWWRAFRGRF